MHACETIFRMLQVCRVLAKLWTLNLKTGTSVNQDANSFRVCLERKQEERINIVLRRIYTRARAKAKVIFILFSLLCCVFTLQRFPSKANSILLCLHVLNNGLFLPCGIVLILFTLKASQCLRLYIISYLNFV